MPSPRIRIRRFLSLRRCLRRAGAGQAAGSGRGAEERPLASGIYLYRLVTAARGSDPQARAAAVKCSMDESRPRPG